MCEVTDPLATDQRGNALVAFELGSESDLKHLDASISCPLSLVLVWHAGRCLLVFDRWKQAWELPGGMREGAETPRQAAARELLEETGEQPGELAYLGVARFRLAPTGREEYGAVYEAHVDQPGSFIENDEVSAITWWDPAEPREGLDGPDAAIVRLARRGSAQRRARDR